MTTDKCPTCGCTPSATAKQALQAEILRQVESFATEWSGIPVMEDHLDGARAMAVHLLMDAPRVYPSDAESMCDAAIARGKSKLTTMPESAK